MVDTTALLGGVVGVGGAFLTVVMLSVMFSEIGNSNIAALDPTDNSSPVAIVTGNATIQIGSIVTTWGTIIILGLIIISVFVSILGALIFLVRKSR